MGLDYGLLRLFSVINGLARLVLVRSNNFQGVFRRGVVMSYIVRIVLVWN